MTGITVYSTPVCPWCTRVKEFLQERNVDFEDVDVSRSHTAAHEMVSKSGQTGVPVVDINGTIIVGFDPARINQALGMS